MKTGDRFFSWPEAKIYPDACALMYFHRLLFNHTMQEAEVKRQLSARKIWIPVLIGLAMAGYLLHSSLSAVRYEPATDGSYEWVDANKDGIMAPSDDAEFRIAEPGKGSYERITYQETLNKIDWGGRALFFLGLAILCVFIRVLAYVARLKILSDGDFDWRQCRDIVLLWEFASALTPSVVGGSAVAVFFLNREGMNLGKSTAIVMVTAMMDEIFYVTMIPIVLLTLGAASLFPESWNMNLFGQSLTAEGFFWGGYGFTFLILTVLIYAIFINPRAFRFILLKIFSLPYLKRWKYKIIEWGNDLLTTSKELKKKPVSYWLKGLSATYISWSFRFILLNCLLLMVVPDIDDLLAFAKQLAMWMIMLISPTPGSSGVAEFAFYQFFGGVMVPFTLVGLLAILWRLLSYFPYLFAGILILPRWLSRTSKK